MSRNVLFITLDQWRGDCLSALGHPLVRTPNLDALAAGGVCFANHWANAAPCGPSRACLLTGTYSFHNRSILNGTPLDDRFTNVARLAASAGLNPVLFGYTDTSVDPRTVEAGDRRLFSYEGVLPGFNPVVVDQWETGGPAWGRWLERRGVEVPTSPHDLYQPMDDFPGAADHGSTWAPTRFAAADSETVFLAESLIDWLEHHGDQPFLAHAAFIRPHPPRRNPVGYHDLFDADDVGPFVGCASAEEEMALHPLNALVMAHSPAAAPRAERERRQLRATYYGAMAEVDDQMGRIFDYLERSGLADDTLVIVTSDHGEMGGDHWLIEKLGYWDESYHVPCVIRDPRTAADAGRGRIVEAFTESVDIVATICEFLGLEVPAQVDGFALTPMLHGLGTPEHWRSAAHYEWSFANPVTRAAESFLGLPMSHCSLVVSRSATTKYVQFAADDAVMPPLLFDLSTDPHQLHNLAGDLRQRDRLYAAARDLVQWRMRNDDRVLATTLLDRQRGAVTSRDEWR